MVWRERCLRAAAVLFAALYAFILVLVLFFNSAFAYNALLQAALLAAWAAALAGLLLVWRRIGPWCRRHKARVLAAALGFVFAVQLCVGLNTVPTPIYDSGDVFFGAAVYAEQGAGAPAFAQYAAYLKLFPNNMGLFLLLQALFKGLHAVGFTAYHAAAVLCGHLLFALALWAMFWYLDAAFGGDAPFAGLGLAMLYLPVYFQSAVVYTDTWSVWCVPCVLLCAQRARAAAGRRRVLWGALAGALLGLGAQIKVTVLIAAIALLLQLLLEGRLRRALPALLAAGVLLAAVWGGFKAWGSAALPGLAGGREAMPTTYWLMTGLAGDGGYNAIDGQSKPTAELYGAALAAQQLQTIRQRLAEMGLPGYLRLLGRKTYRSFGSGEADLGYSYLYAEPSRPVNWVYAVVLRNGPLFPVFNNLAHSFYLMLLLLGVYGAVRAAKERGACRRGFAVYLALVGFWLFMMLWESNHRQLINQWPLLWMAAAAGLCALPRRKREH